MSENNCTNCANSQRLGGLIQCLRTNRVMTTPSKGCEHYKRKNEQIRLEEME